MIYFELYPGDYLRDTTRLTLVEHGAYLRLLMAYYAEEEPLPAEYDALFTIAGATKSVEKEAVKRVADKHFPVGSDGLRHNGRADEEIAKAAERMEAGAERRSNDAERQKRARERRRAMFDQLREQGITPAFNATTAELEALITEHVTSTRHVTGGVTGRDSGRDITRDNTATTRHTPYTNQKQKASPHAPLSPEPPASPPMTTDAGRACLLMRQAGCIQTNPSHPDLLAALAEGVSPEALRDTAAEGIAAGKSKPFAWAITTARSRHAEGATTIPQGANHGHANSGAGRKLSAVEQVEQRIRERRESESGDGATLTLGHG